MLDLMTTSGAARSAPPRPAPAPSIHYSGPERRSASLGLWRWLAAALDEIDYGIVLLGADGLVRHANQAARDELDEQHPLALLHSELRARRSGDAHALQAALHDAQQRGLRRLITVGEPAQQASVSVVPLGVPGATLVILGKRSVGAELAVQGFARLHGLTGSEARVLARLVAGARPAAIAQEHGVALSTVRTQVGSIRLKTGAASIRALVEQVARLPPLMGRLRSHSPEPLGAMLQGLVMA